MTRVIVTFGTGPHAEMLDIARPSFEAYAERHGYEIRTPMSVSLLERIHRRPLSWLKIPLLRAALDIWDEVLWLDADVVIVDGTEDIAAHVPERQWQGLGMHVTTDGPHPNHGVWLVRQPMQPVLARIWSMVHHLHHPWWEQAASLELMGFDPTRLPVRLVEPTELLERTELLGSEWNALPEWRGHARFRHAASAPDRVSLMRGWAHDAQLAA